MGKPRIKPNYRRRVLRLPDLDHCKLAVLNSLGSPASRRVYEYAIDQFIAWYCSEPRLAFNRIVVVRYRMYLESRRLAANTINQQLAAVRSSFLPSLLVGFSTTNFTRAGEPTLLWNHFTNYGTGGCEPFRPVSFVFRFQRSFLKMAGITKSVSVRPLHPFSPNCLHMPTVGATIQLFAFALDQDNLPISPGFAWTTDNAGVATVNGSGLVTGVANGICTITVVANDNAAAKARTSVGVALLSANSLTIANGKTTTLSSVGGFATVNWVGGCPAAAEVVAGTINGGGFVVPDHSSTAWNSGPTATIKTPVFTGSSSFTATAHVPVQVSVGGIYCAATVNVTGVPNWAGA